MGQVRPSAAGTYNFSAGDEARVVGTIAITRKVARSDRVVCARVACHELASNAHPIAAFLVVAALVLIQQITGFASREESRQAEPS
jgi:hypothetical protein